ncbi:hypothetical protein D3C86_1345400 [compost metagenome]
MRRQRECVTRTLHLFTIVGAVHHLVGAEWAGHAHIGFVTQHVIGASQLGLDRRDHQFGSARAQTDHRQSAAQTANRQGIQRFLGYRDGNGLITQDQYRLLDGVACQRAERTDIVGKAQRHAQLKRRFTQRRTGHFGVGSQQTGHRLHGDLCPMQRVANGAGHTDCAGTHRDHYVTRIDQQLVGRRLALGMTDMHRQPCSRIFRQLCLR